MSDEPNTGRMPVSRRRILQALGGGAGIAAVTSGLDTDGDDGDLYGGTMALQEAYKFAEGPDGALWIGPDSAKSNVDAKSGNVYLASDTDVDYYGDGGSWNLRDVGSESQPVPAVHTEDAEITEDLNPTGRVRGASAPFWKGSFSAEFVQRAGSPFKTSDFNPDFYDKRYFDDGEYRVTVDNNNDDTTRLYRTPDPADFGAYEELSSDIFPTLASGTRSTQDHIRVDGEWLVYNTTAGAGTSVWKGTDLENLSEVGTVISDRSDCGVAYEEDANTIHIYTEDGSAGASSEQIEHYTTPDDDLLNYTQQADAIDVSGFGWTTGDPELVEINGFWYMFMDRTVESSGHPNYHIALARSDDLDTWTILNPKLTPGRKGGDITVIQVGGHFEALTEYDDGDTEIGHWRLWYEPTTSNIQMEGDRMQISHAGRGDAFAGLLGRGALGNVNDGYGYYVNRDSDVDPSVGPGYYLLNETGNTSVIGRLRAISGNDIRLAAAAVLELSSIAGSQTELQIGGDFVKEQATSGYQKQALSSDPGAAPSGFVKWVVSDGANWDPDSDGNAEIGVMLPDGSFVEVADLGTTL